MESNGEEKVELEDILKKLQDDGLDTDACSATEHLSHLWRIYLRAEGTLQATMQDLEGVRQQQASEMKEVENYVDHIRNLSEEREALTAEYERENELLKMELQRLKLEQETQVKEVEEMLEQEGLAEIAHSGPSEQVAYLLVERATLLEKLESADRNVDSQSVTGSIRETHLQDQMRQTLEEELKQQRETMQRTKETMAKEPLSEPASPWKKLFGVRQQTHSVSKDIATHEEDLEKERKLRERAERDLDEAARRLEMAHEEIRRLTDELDMERKVHSSNDTTLQTACQEIKTLKEEVSKLVESDFMELDKAKEQNSKLDEEILALRERVRSLDSERKSLLEVVDNLQKAQPAQAQQPSSLQNKMDQLKPENKEPAQQVGSQSQPIKEIPVPAVRKKHKILSSSRSPSKECPVTDVEQESLLLDSGHDMHHPKSEALHKRCHHEINRLDSKNHDLQRKLHRLQQDLEELMMRNETLETNLGEHRNHPRDGQHSTDCEKEVLKAKITSMETDYAKLKRKYKELKAKSHEVISAVSKEQDIQEQLKRSQMTMESVQQRLEEEVKNREYLEGALSNAQQSKIRAEEELEAFRTQVHYLSMEIKNYHAAAEQNQALNAALERMQLENNALEQKLNKMLEDHREISNCQGIQNNCWKEMADKYQCQIADLKKTIQKLQEEKVSAFNQMTDPSNKNLEFMQQQLNTVLKENQQLNEDNLILRQQLCSDQHGSQNMNQEICKLRQQLNASQQESKLLAQENYTIRQQLGCSQQENQRLNQEVSNIQKQLTDLVHSKEQVEDNITQVQLQALKLEISQLQNSLELEQKNSYQHKQALELQLEEANNRAKSQEMLLQQHTEESRQMRQDLQRVHNLCSTAEKELKYKREQLIELQRQISLLDQENNRMNLEYKTAQCRVSELDQHNLVLKSENEMKQQRLKELEMESNKTFHLSKQLKSVQDELVAEKNKTQSAEKKTAEIQQQLCNIQHQLRLSEARNKEREVLETELKESRDTAAKLKNQLQEELLQRKLADQNTEELQKQIKSMLEKEGCLARGKCDLEQQMQQQESRMHVLEEEKEALYSENLSNQKANKKLMDEICTLKQEIEKLKEELQNMLQQLDSQVRLYNEKQMRHKQKLRKAKEIFIREVMLRDGKIKHLESEIKLMKNLMDKEHAWNMKVTYENDLLLVEKRELLQQLSEQEDAVRNNNSVVCNVKHRINYLEEENKQLQDETVKLSDRLGSLERSLKIIKTDPSKSQHPENLSVSFPQDVCRLPYNDTSLKSGTFMSSTRETPSPNDHSNFGSLESIRRTKTLESSDGTKSTFPTLSLHSDVGYLNLTSSPRYRDQEEFCSLASDEV
ncbi:coiled-coil domain-containing protein 30 isoform X2 [Hemiscyllium ocellatum]|uniref:coiled-coil domain-containing protein 30 isoform X2 n=1 Tax=Hemiscyllium ocellatum TaxID=170820 RepID=UPI002966F84E|nr:coiled-coil domain-containing protein 30 isoform X2 [Hemiscyllium ocellatum]